MFLQIGDTQTLSFHRGSISARLAQFKANGKRRVCGPYMRTVHNLQPGQGWSFYLASDFAPGLRWQWADQACRNIDHTGWFADQYGDGEKIRGIVCQLPHNRGWLAGWSMGEGMASELEPEIYPDETGAAYAADSIAESAAEREREYQALESAKLNIEQYHDQAVECRAEFHTLAADYRTQAGTLADSIRVTCRLELRRLRTEARRAIKQARLLSEHYGLEWGALQ